MLFFDVDNLDDPDRRILAATYNDVRVLDLYVVNGQQVGSEKYAHKLMWLSRVTEYVATQLERYSKFVVVGDFNIAPEDRDVHDPHAWREKILCSTPRARGTRALTKARFNRYVQTFRAGRKKFQLVGLPRRRIQKKCRIAY